MPLPRQLPASLRRVRKAAAPAVRRIGSALRQREAYREWDEMPMEMRGVRLQDLGLADRNRVDHIPSFRKTLPRILPPSEVTADDVFLDLGSGMGRMVVFAAAKYPFRRVIGVELSSDLHEIAKRNVAQNSALLRCRDVELFNEDVLAFRIPDDVTVVYLYNPFSGPVFQHVVDELERSVERRPREIRVVYLTPREEKRLLASPRVRLVRSARVVRGDLSDNSIVRLYSVRPSPGDG